MGQSVAFIESLESRVLCSASPAGHGYRVAHHDGPAPIVAAAAAAKKATKLAKSLSAPVSNDLVGTWQGTLVVSPKKPALPITITVLPGATVSPTETNYTITIDLSALGGAADTRTSITFRPQTRDALTNARTSTVYASMVVGVSLNATQMAGRWCSLVGSKWTTGTVTLNKA
jgi:hypothetical protein